MLPSPGCRGPLHDTNTRRDQKPAPAESAAVRGGKLQSKGLGFGARCKKPSRLHTLLTHRNLRHARRRLKRAFRFRRVLWLLSSKESNNKKNPCSKNDHLCASRRGPWRPSVGLAVGTGVPRDMCCAGLLSGGFLSAKVHEGHEGRMCRHGSRCSRDIPPACPLCVWG
jgi:hypothetical protein